MEVRKPLDRHDDKSAAGQAEGSGQKPALHKNHSGDGLSFRCKALARKLIERVYAARLVHLIALLFAIGVLILIAGISIAPRLFPPPEWMKKNFDRMNEVDVKEVEPIFVELQKQISPAELKQYCDSHPFKWYILENGKEFFSCFDDFLPPSLSKIKFFSTDNPNISKGQFTLSFGPHFEPNEPGFEKKGKHGSGPFSPPFNPGEPGFERRGKHGPHPFPTRINIFNFSSEKYTYVLFLPEKKPPKFPGHDEPIIFIAIVSVVLLCLILAIVQYMLSPFKEIDQALEEYAQGNFRFRPKRRGIKELRRLTEGLVKMSGELELLIENKNRLLIDISHELKTPLARLRVHIPLAREDASEIEQIEKDVIEMSTLVERILDNARGAYKHTKLEKQIIDFKELVEKLFEMIQGRANAKGATTSLSFHPHETDETWHIMGEEKSLRSAIENVLDNALKYCASEQGIVEVSARAFANHIILQICNNGSEILPNHQKLIFEPFYRIDDSRTRSTGGHGLGLSIAKRLALAHGGDLILEESLPGKTIFTFTFPKK